MGGRYFGEQINTTAVTAQAAAAAAAVEAAAGWAVEVDAATEAAGVTTTVAAPGLALDACSALHSQPASSHWTTDARSAGSSQSDARAASPSQSYSQLDVAAAVEKVDKVGKAVAECTQGHLPACKPVATGTVTADAIVTRTGTGIGVDITPGTAPTPGTVPMRINYVGFPTSTTITHAHHVCSKYALHISPVELRVPPMLSPSREREVQGSKPTTLRLLPLLQFYDSMHVASTRWYLSRVFGRKRYTNMPRGGFIEDTLGGGGLRRFPIGHPLSVQHVVAFERPIRKQQLLCHINPQQLINPSAICYFVA